MLTHYDDILLGFAEHPVSSEQKDRGIKKVTVMKHPLPWSTGYLYDPDWTGPNCMKAGPTSGSFR